MPKLSIIVPIFQKEKFLSKCLDSICAQSLSDFEIICVNDGSTDGSSEILGKHAASDARIVIHSKPNGGVSSARNAGVSLASGQYITFVDPDDHLIDPFAYENMIKIAEAEGSDIVFSFFHDCDENLQVFNDRFAGFDSRSAATPWEKARFIEFGYPWQKIYEANFYKNSKIAFPADIVFEDNPVNIKLIISARRIGVYPNYIFNYVHHGESITAQRSLKAFDMFSAVALMEDYVSDSKVTDREFITRYLDYRLELLAWGYYSLPPAIEHKRRYIERWEKVLTPRDLRRLRDRPQRRFGDIYKYLATGRAQFLVLDEWGRAMPRALYWPIRQVYSLAAIFNLSFAWRRILAEPA